MAINYGTPGFNPYAAGAKIYGGSRYNPTMGPVDKAGYRERDRLRQVRRNAINARLKSQTKGAYGSSDVGRYM